MGEITVYSAYETRKFGIRVVDLQNALAKITTNRNQVDIGEKMHLTRKCARILLLKRFSRTAETPPSPVAATSRPTSFAMDRFLTWTSETWPLQGEVLILPCRFPMIVLRGVELIQIYNDGYLAASYLTDFPNPISAQGASKR